LLTFDGYIERSKNEGEPMFRSVVALVSLASATSALSAAASSPATIQAAKARRIIAQRLVDPDSVRLRGIRIATATVDGREVKLLCGEYNSKNRLGGFVGFKPFVYEASVMKGVLTLGDEYDYDFFSESDAGDFIQSQTDEVMEAAAAAGRLDAVTAELQAANHRYGDFAVKYFPVCLGSS
jgi:hypothetical protein